MEKIENQERYREIIYSGGALNSATLTINDTEIPVSRIKSIKINSPIIDTEKDYFYVGTFVAQKVTIQFKNADSIELTGKVKLTISTMVDGVKTDVNMGEWLIDTTPENYYKTATITCYDKSILFKTSIDISQFFDEEGKVTAEDLLKALCNHYLGENMLGTYPDVNRTASTALYDNSKSGKYYIGDIAEIMGGNAKIGRDGKLYIIPLKQEPAVTINANKGKSWVLNSHYKISRVFYENLARKYDFGEATDNSLNIRSTNVFVNDNETSGEEIIQNLYNELVGFEMYAIKHENYGDPTLDAWDIIDFQVNGVSYPSYNSNTLTYEQNIMSTYETKIPSKQKEETTNVVKNEDAKYYNISTTVNQIEGKVEQTIEQVGGFDERISQAEQTVDGFRKTVTAIETTANEAKDTANEAKTTADNTSNNLKNNYSTTTQMNSAISQSASSITSSVNKSITTAKQEAIDEAVDSANTNTDNKLKNYSTTTQMNNAITQKIDDAENSITASVSEQITDAEGNINKNVDGKLELYIKKGKEGKDDLISGFNLNANEVEINSDNFKLDKEGNITFNNGNASNLNINGGTINITRKINEYDHLPILIEQEVTDGHNIDKMNIQVAGGGLYTQTDTASFASPRGTMRNLVAITNSAGDSGTILLYNGNDTTGVMLSGGYGIDQSNVAGPIIWLSSKDGSDSKISLYSGDPSSSEQYYIETPYLRLSETPTASNHAVRLQDLDNAVGKIPFEFVLWEGSRAFADNNQFFYLTTFYELKICIERVYPLKSGHTRTAKLCMTYSDNINSTEGHNIHLQGGSLDKSYIFYCVWGNPSEEGGRVTRVADFNYNDIPANQHVTITVSPPWGSGGTLRIYKLSLLIYDN